MTERNRALHATKQDARARLLAPIPATERRVQAAGLSTAVLEGGEGAPIVLLHGAGEFAATWMRAIPDLVTTNRVVVPDLPGHGASEIGEGKLDAGRVSAWLGELIDETCPSPPVLVGHLLGGAIGARFAVDHGDRINRLVLVDSLGLVRFRPAPRFALAMVRFAVRPTERSLERMFRECVVDLDGLRGELGESWDALADYALDCARAPGQRAAIRGLMSGFGGPIPAADLARIAVPTTLIWGRHDLQVRLGVAQAASDRYGWPLQVIDDAADDPAFEQPEAFGAALRSVLGSR